MNKKHIFFRVHVTQSVLNILNQYRQTNKKQHESGGILLGQVCANNVYITKVSIPNEFDKSSRYSFVCDSKAAQVIINHEFINSNRKTIYIGEWHTHPENDPKPSIVDKKMIKSQFHNNKLSEPFLILLILGIKSQYVSIYDGKKIRRVDINIIGDDDV